MEVQPKSPTTKGAGDSFMGDVYIDAVAQAQSAPLTIGSVHFTPCAHTAWHHHTIGHPLRRRGRGSRAVPQRTGHHHRPGDVIRIAGNEEHWHGAASEHFMTHLAITEGDTVWGAHLTDEEYELAR
jgi:quercetin dioxygenase-like cupin family protein